MSSTPERGQGEGERGGRHLASGPFCPHVPHSSSPAQSLPTPLAWLSFLSHGLPSGGMADGGASRGRVRWPTTHSVGARIPLWVAEVEQRQRALKLGTLRGHLCVDLRRGGPSALEGICLVSVPIQQGRNGCIPCGDGVLSPHSALCPMPTTAPGPQAALGKCQGRNG